MKTQIIVITFAALALTACSEKEADVASSASKDTPTAAIGKVVTVDAGSPGGTRLGSFKKGQTITLQYVEGMWTVFSDAKPPWIEQSPDDEGKIREWHRTALCKYDGQKNMLVTVLPGGTKTSPYSYTMEEDADMVLLCNDVVSGNRTHNNKGTATYRLDVK